MGEETGREYRIGEEEQKGLEVEEIVKQTNKLKERKKDNGGKIMKNKASIYSGVKIGMILVKIMKTIYKEKGLLKDWKGIFKHSYLRKDMKKVKN